jgi:predicted secreted Zn-dependent protease
VRHLSLLVLCALLLTCTRHSSVPGLETITPPAGVNVEEGVETYPIVGADRATIGAALRAGVADANGRRFAGYHTWNITWHYETHAELAHCSIVRVTVTLTSTVTLPVWTPPPGVESSLVAEWGRYRRALAVHERGHRALTYAGAGRILRAIEGLGDQSCAFIGSSVRAVAEPLLAALRSEDARYDLETRHGATQGATWRPGTSVLPI